MLNWWLWLWGMKLKKISTVFKAWWLLTEVNTWCLVFFLLLTWLPSSFIIHLILMNSVCLNDVDGCPFWTLKSDDMVVDIRCYANKKKKKIFTKIFHFLNQVDYINLICLIVKTTTTNRSFGPIISCKQWWIISSSLSMILHSISSLTNKKSWWPSTGIIIIIIIIWLS